MKKIIIFYILLSAFGLSIIAQINYFEINDSLISNANDTVSQTKNETIILKKIEKIGIIEPFVFKNITAVKNIILTTIKDELTNQFEYNILKNDSIIIAYEDKDLKFLQEFILKRDTFDAFMVIRHGFIQVDYKSYSVTVHQKYETHIEILVYNKQGTLIARSYKNTNTPLNFSFGHNAMKTIERATKSAVSSIVEKLNTINTIIQKQSKS